MRFSAFVSSRFFELLFVIVPLLNFVIKCSFLGNQAYGNDGPTVELPPWETNDEALG